MKKGDYKVLAYIACMINLISESQEAIQMFGNILLEN